MGSSQECFEVAQNRGESTKKKRWREGREDAICPLQRMLLQVSPCPAEPGALSTSLDGALRVWYGPTMGAAFSGHSFAPPWLECFLSSLWFPSRCRCPAASRERPGEAASHLPGLPCRRGVSRTTPGGRRETHHWAAAHRVCQFWHRHPLPSLRLFDPGHPAPARRERSLAGDATPPVPSSLQTVTVTAIPEAARCNIAPRQLDVPGSSFGNHSDMPH